ncbi:hypothetical protein AVI53_13590 [Piscirickettsia salmonis]|uniref:hypothetical protein n=1 Tax=Piscirickettsia salmonis TaxID=1238 RepID=UPI000481CD9E|nr:hypothetical protein [Piscirickettsia salmonis]ALT18199.1 hypothetical protein PSLF89_04470 [Piscirickettsia salmonis LF-89 = ATCC VR-1361]ALY02076.1 hypothetical protein AWE47_03660 [Piscirickettsia salmonis]AMA41589.1 hypothetical protein AWJ11_03655 [Piscirickettsia salmonis]AOS34072.1 hypothetical protein AVM72_00890 [Piscirickettsia salmonis]APS61476.1 hypothetical protein AVI53_13590 [Piscirickettsia salmonis]
MDCVVNDLYENNKYVVLIFYLFYVKLRVIYLLCLVILKGESFLRLIKGNRANSQQVQLLIIK